MSVSNKLRAVLNLTGAKPADLSDCLGKSVQSVRNKFSQDSFSVADVLRICNYLDCELSISTKDGQVVLFTMDDVKQEADGVKPEGDCNQ